jgi:3-hydroxyisobutyrate dehydrogenase-like beta-hydroxyacid dehydrogenase
MARMNEAPVIGFIGFGEAAFHIAKGLRQAGIPAIAAYDIRSDALILRRAEEAGAKLVASNAELAAASNIIFSTVTANQALAAAEATAPHLKPAHLYADLNSVSPGLKQALAKVIEASAAKFVEVAVMAPVPPYGHKVPLLTGGHHAPEFAARLLPFGMKIETGTAHIGDAAATKMCRSIMVKGIEALMTECVLTARHHGVDEKVLASLGESFPGMDWAKLASYLVARVAVHGERRAREMEEVAETVREAGVEPMMAEATVRRMDWSAHLNLKEAFGGKAPADYKEFARKVAEIISATPTGSARSSGA